MTRRLGLGATIAIIALLLAACSSSGGSAASAPAATAAAPTSARASAAASTCSVSGSGGTAETIKSFAFPTGLSIKAGDAITWTNGDSATHTVTFDDGSCNSGPIAAGSSVTVTYTVPGTYPFHCSIHTSMTGTLEVKG